MVKTNEKAVSPSINVVSYHKTFKGALAKVQEVEQNFLSNYKRYAQEGMEYDAVHTKGMNDPDGVWSNTSIYRQGATQPRLNEVVVTIWISKQELAA